MNRHRTHSSRGISIVYMSVVIVVICCFVSIGVDYGRVQLAKTELQRNADASARAAVQALRSGVTAAQMAATSVAGSNHVDGIEVALDPNQDIEFGTWDTTARSFAVLSGAARSTANAVRVTARRTTA